MGQWFVLGSTVSIYANIHSATNFACMPQFYVSGEWLSAEGLFGTLESLAKTNPRPFTNDAESMFDAIDHTAVDFHGDTAHCNGGQCDLSQFIVGDAGNFVTRDELFETHPLFQRTLRGKAFEMVYGGRKSA